MPAAGHFAGGSGGGCTRSRYDGADIPGLAAFQHAPMAAGAGMEHAVLHSLAQAAPSFGFGFGLLRDSGLFNSSHTN